MRLVIVRDQRHRYRRQAEEAAFHCGRHGARIDHVVAQIGRIIDPGDHDVRVIIEHTGECQMHAVGRRAGHCAGLRIDAAGADRHIQRQRIAGAGAIAVGRDHHHFVTGMAQRLGQIWMPGRRHRRRC